MHDTDVDVLEVMLAQVHRRTDDVVAVVGDPPASSAWDLGDRPVGIQAR